jgi:hypothetical protein
MYNPREELLNFTKESVFSNNYERNLYLRGGLGGSDIIQNIAIEKVKDKIKIGLYANDLLSQEELYICYMMYGEIIEELKKHEPKYDGSTLNLIEAFLMDKNRKYGLYLLSDMLIEVHFTEKSKIVDELVVNPNASFMDKISGNNKIFKKIKINSRVQKEQARLNKFLLLDLCTLIKKYPKNEWDISLIKN